MNQEELTKAIEKARNEIYYIKNQIEELNDPEGEKQLVARLKELQIKQIWYLDQLKA